MYLLFDIGGTNTRIAVSKDGTAIGEAKIIPTQEDFEKGVEALSVAASALSGGERFSAAAVGIAGPLNPEKTGLFRAPNLPDWAGKDLKKELEKILMCPVFIENDTAMAGLGEARDGAGKGYGVVAYMTVSTGVGGVRIVDGKIDRNALGFEPGHQIIEIGGSFCRSCETSGHLEAYVSGRSLEARYDKKPKEIIDEGIWDETAHFLAVGLNNTIVHWSPDIVVLGGSMMKEVGIPIDRVVAYLEKILKIFPKIPPIVKASLGDIGGIHGALVYIEQNLIRI